MGDVLQCNLYATIVFEIICVRFTGAVA